MWLLLFPANWFLDRPRIIFGTELNQLWLAIRGAGQLTKTELFSGELPRWGEQALIRVWYEDGLDDW